MGAFAKFGGFLKAAHEAGAVAVIGGQGGRKAAGMHLTHTGALGFDAYYDIPVVSMAAEDQEQLERYLDRGKTVRLKINVQNRVTDGPVDSANVVGEIRGTENPEQIIVVGGHLDSWDLASGSTDNGCGATVTLGAAEAIIKSGFKPRRTIRFVLFTGEEQGLLGSLAYVKAHQSDMSNYVAALILDFGQGPVTGFQMGGHDDLIPAVQKFASFAAGLRRSKSRRRRRIRHRYRPLHSRRPSRHQSQSGFAGLQIHASLSRRYVRQSPGRHPRSQRHRHGSRRVLDRRPPGASRQSMAARKNRENAN